MSTKKKSSPAKIVRLDAKDVKPPTKAEMQRLIKAMNGPVDTSEMAEWTSEDFRKAIRGSAPSVAKSSATKRGSRGKVA